MKGLLIFVGGLIVGAGTTYIIQKNKYEEMVKEELEEMKEHIMSELKNEKKCGCQESKQNIVDEVKERKEEIKKERPKNKYGNLTRDEVYEPTEEEIEQNDDIIDVNRYATSNEDMTEANKYNNPHIITPEDFGTICGFDVGTFNLNSDDIMTDDDHRQLDDEEVVDLLGLSSYEINKHFGDYENDPDTVYIRNIKMKCDYEILKDESNI